MECEGRRVRLTCVAVVETVHHGCDRCATSTSGKAEAHAWRSLQRIEQLHHVYY